MQSGFPRPHLAIVALLSLGLSSLVMAKFAEDPADDRVSPEAVLEEITSAPTAAETFARLDELTLALPAEPVAAASNAPEPVQANVEVREATVRPGDNLSTIFKREGIAYRELQRLLDTAGPLASRLRNIFPGQALTFSITEEQTLAELLYQPARLERLRFKREGDVFIASEEVDEPTRRRAYRHAIIDHSLFVASQRAGLSDDLTMRLAQIYQWDIDFVLDIRKGDQFHVLYDELYLGEERIGSGEILAAEFINQGEVHRATRFEAADGRADYFNPEGNSMRKAFLRAPVSFSRISSNFNLRRLHPLHNKRIPHRGIDYAAPVGTPVMAAGDGRVSAATRNRANGNYVFIQHGEQFTTKYLHLSKFGRGIRKGAKVKQGQIIGYVGATGMVTGAHLHYEFLVNGVHRNPRTVPLPNAEPIAEEELPRFRDQSQTLLALLDQYKGQSVDLNQVASQP